MSEAEARTAAQNMERLAPHVAELVAFGLWLPLLRDFRRHESQLDQLLELRRSWDSDPTGPAVEGSLNDLQKQLQKRGAELSPKRSADADGGKVSSL